MLEAIKPGKDLLSLLLSSCFSFSFSSLFPNKVVASSSVDGSSLVLTFRSKVTFFLGLQFEYNHIKIKIKTAKNK
jgi:hypothetical protein